MEDLPEITTDELKERVFYSFSKTAGKLARLFEMPLKEARKWFEVAYYDVLSDEGLSQHRAAEVLGVSTRKVVQLASALKTNFYRPEQQGGLPRRIEFMLWAGEMSEGRIRQSLGDADDAEIEAALQQLVDEERVVRKPGRTTYYEVPSGKFRLFQDDWIARIDGLNNHLSNVLDGIYARFFDDSDQAFARTLTFRCREDDLDELREVYEDIIFPKLHELEFKLDKDPDADPETDAVEVRLSLNWAPHRYYERVVDSEPEDES